jgi:putative ABC transport system ATP-binding protein
MFEQLHQWRATAQSTQSDRAPNLIELRQVNKDYDSPAGKFRALQEVTLTIQPGEFVTIVGKSGSGKSTLLNVLTGIDRPTSGAVCVDGVAVHDLSENELAVWRGRNVGVVFQFFQLLPTLTVLENVMLPMDFRNSLPLRDRERRAHELLALVGVADQADKLPTSLSGGQQQRAAIARALANDPPVVVADEPTGNLDSHTSEAIFQLFRDLTQRGKTVIVVTHDRDWAQRGIRSIQLADGVIVAGQEG